MDAGALDVLEDAWDDDVLAVERCVDFDFGSAKYLSTSSGACGKIGGALSAYAASCASLYTISMPRPPSTYDGLTRTGNPISRATSRALRNDSAVRPAGRATPSLASTASNFSRSSARSRAR